MPEPATRSRVRLAAARGSLVPPVPSFLREQHPERVGAEHRARGVRLTAWSSAVHRMRVLARHGQTRLMYPFDVSSVLRRSLIGSTGADPTLPYTPPRRHRLTASPDRMTRFWTNGQCHRCWLQAGSGTERPAGSAGAFRGATPPRRPLQCYPSERVIYQRRARDLRFSPDRMSPSRYLGYSGGNSCG